METSEVLNKAADLIEERGWVRGIEGWATEPSGLCLEGALAAAMGQDVERDRIPSRAFYRCSAYNAVAAYLGRKPSPTESPIADALWQWNDDADREAGQVIATLRAAALIEAAKENADMRAQVTA